MNSTTTPQQRTIAKTLCTEKEYAAWELVEVHGWSERRGAEFMGLSRTAFRDRYARARGRIAGYSQAEFVDEPDREKHHRKPNYERKGVSLVMVRALLIERDGAACYLCHREKPEAELEVEHIIPRADGGTDQAWNLALACGPCNVRKNARYVSMLTTSHRAVYHQR